MRGNINEFGIYFEPKSRAEYGENGKYSSRILTFKKVYNLHDLRHANSFPGLPKIYFTHRYFSNLENLFKIFEIEQLPLSEFEHPWTIFTPRTRKDEAFKCVIVIFEHPDILKIIWGLVDHVGCILSNLFDTWAILHHPNPSEGSILSILDDYSKYIKDLFHLPQLTLSNINDSLYNINKICGDSKDWLEISDMQFVEFLINDLINTNIVYDKITKSLPEMVTLKTFILTLLSVSLALVSLFFSLIFSGTLKTK